MFAKENLENSKNILLSSWYEPLVVLMLMVIRDIFIFDGGNKRLRNVTNLYYQCKFLKEVRDFDSNAANWQ
jgi:hypothetical protein